MFYLWFVFHAELDYSKISLLIQGISFYLYIPLSLSSSCLLCAVYIPPVLHVLNIVFICQITFVSPILYLSRKSYLMMLDNVHHQGLRLALGAFRTSPVESLYVEAEEPSLYIRREKLALQYAI